MVILKSPINRLAKVGPKYQELLQKLEIYTVEDMLYHFPFRYDDFSVIKKIDEITEGETVTIRAELLDVKNIFTKYGKRITRAVVNDESGKLIIIWFNQHYLSKILIPTNTYSFSGRVGAISGKLAMVAPSFEEYRPGSLNTGRLVPVYQETAGITSKWLRSRINDLLFNIGSIPEYLPLEIINKYNFDVFDIAIRKFHFPQNLAEVDHAKKRFAFEEFFLELLRVESRRSQWSLKDKGIELKIDPSKLENFITQLPFKLTPSQQTAIQKITIELASQTPMNILLEGDVGSGKTIVAVLAAYVTYLNGYKTLYLAPTEILANQHFDTFKKYLSSHNINVELQTGSTKPKGEWDILIGTHSLLFNEADQKTALVIIDEQHRFGVEQRAKILNIKSENKVPHLLTMTATPIPRTLALTLYGDLSIAQLKEHPNINKKITTKVVTDKNRQETYKWIKQRGEQAFVVCPLIDTSDKESLENVKAAQTEFLALQAGILEGVSVGLLHGRMKAIEKEAVIKQFRSKEIQVLVSTPVIEVGIDIPDASIIVIESAERYGLASLHQLRGRVGRGDKEGFCFVFMSNNSRKAYERLKYLENVDSGIELAEIDLKMRGYGDLYGTLQHGFKNFKVADLSDLETLEKAKLDAQNFFPKLNGYPTLKEKLEIDSKLVGNN